MLRVVSLFAALILTSLTALGQDTKDPMKKTRPPMGVVQQGQTYTLIAWNDLGMHCISPRFAEMAILPPYNNLKAIVIRRAGEPRIVSSGVYVSYWMDNNINVAGKTDFWTYAPKLFGKPLAPGIGLTGNGLVGRMSLSGQVWEASGVPALPYYDNLTWNPFQRATVTLATSKTGAPLNITSMVVPVSDEMNCAKCHKTGGVASTGIATATLEGNILTLHDKKEGTALMKHRPVLCASCHSDNALGTAGTAGVKSMSLAMHGKHAGLDAAVQPACYDCHPGTKTQCNRSGIADMGPVHGDPKCDNCHGDLQKMAASLRAGRKPWLEEPTCEQCHGKAYSTGKLLYRNATGHGGVPCIACHNSPHAWWPSNRTDDNLQPMAMQGKARAIGYKKCGICHTQGQSGIVPPHNEDD